MQRGWRASLSLLRGEGEERLGSNEIVSPVKPRRSNLTRVYQSLCHPLPAL